MSVGQQQDDPQQFMVVVSAILGNVPSRDALAQV